MMQATIIDVIRALSLKITAEFPRYPVQDRDVNEDFPRPCSFIDVGDVTSVMISELIEEETANCDIFLFEEDLYEGFLRLLELKGSIVDSLLPPLKVTCEDGTVSHVLFENLRVIVSKADKALQVSFSVTLHTAHAASDDNLPVMADLESRL